MGRRRFNRRAAALRQLRPQRLVARDDVTPVERRLRSFAELGATAEDCLPYVRRGHMWVWEEDQKILGISASDCKTGWIWALFVRPGHEGRGIGRALFAAACTALMAAGFRILRLSTDPDTRAARFYRAAGWREAGRTPDGELIFGFDV